MAGAAHLAASGGRWCYEVEVLDEAGKLRVGLVGTSLGPQCAVVGDDACSWGFYNYDGDGRHRLCARGGGAGLRGGSERCRSGLGPLGSAPTRAAL